MITANQRKALQAAGYIVKGNTVQNSKGATVGGYNENGQIFSGNSSVRNILKSKGEAAKPASSAPRRSTKASVVPKSNVAKDAMKGYRAGDITTNKLSNVRGGRGDGRKEMIVRAADRAIDNAGKPKAMTEAPKQGKPPKAGPKITLVKPPALPKKEDKKKKPHWAFRAGQAAGRAYNALRGK